MAAWLSRSAACGICSLRRPLCGGALRWSSSALQEKLRSVQDLPHVSALEMLYRVLVQGYFSSLHMLQVYEKQLYGPIYKNGRNAVSVSSAELLEELVRKDDKFPTRGDMDLWTEYREMRGLGYGPLTEEGERWYKLRAVLNKRMLHPRDSAQYDGVINAVVTDFIKRIKRLRLCSPTGDLVPDIANKFYLFSLEGISSILFEARLGCLSEEIPAGTQEFITSISQMFSNAIYVAIFPKWSRSLLPYWQRYIASWDGIFSFGKTLIDKKMEDIQQRVDNDQDVEDEYLTYLLSNSQMSTRDIYASVTELLLAGVDTTSNTLTWALYQLSRNPETQNRLYEEVSSLVPADRIPSAAEVTAMPFLRAVIKETLRMYPVVPINSRIIKEKPVAVGGYQFPEKTGFTLCHYAISHDENIFPEPYRFKPERWLRDGRQRPNAFGSIPFGYGVRGCVGRRIAELEMYLVLFRLIREFEIKPNPTADDLKIVSRAVLVPNKQLDLHFVDRR
ncbi:sterol 26-hydroxylase, mitochondrial-like [Xiphophorus couchianus]|uniref:Cytochrome P450, family 27, subfamily A, polypeptide 7 n=1 Tax=Xiphophorus couchianus TaxID=32473 RepID=A0A3B5M9A3_9TELE|nr:sterol 26-hydroxylase, mitochondrial-like [Xiphophorus couchianus]